MRRIEFLAPVESMRGNLSGDQVLEYPADNNAAYFAPDNKRSYARNYGTRYIGAKRASTNLKYFNVRTRSAVLNSPEAKLQQAAFGAARIIFRELSLASGEVYAVFMKIYAKESARYKTLAACICAYITRGLKMRSTSFVIGDPLATAANKVVVANPWTTDTPPVGAVTVTLTKDVLIKFADALGNPDTFKFITVNGIRQALPTGTDFYGLIDNANLQKFTTAQFTSQTVSEKSYVQFGGAFLTENGAYIETLTNIDFGGKYYTTADSPA